MQGLSLHLLIYPSILMNMPGTFAQFLEKVRPEIQDDVVSVIQFGSLQGIEHPETSDIDLFVITTNKQVIPQVSSIIRSYEKAILGITHTKTTTLIEKLSFASNDFIGIHLMILSQAELGDNFTLLSLRLKLISTLLISRPIFMYNIMHSHHILLGKNVFQNMTIPPVGLRDRILLLGAPTFALILLPLLVNDKINFRIWCFKLVKYVSDPLQTYTKISLKRDNLPLTSVISRADIYEMTQQYRHHPQAYPFSNWRLYATVWAFYLANVPFLWRGAKLSKDW